jgi:hypothetical protein
MKKSTLIATIAFAFTLLLLQMQMPRNFLILTKALWMWLPPYGLQKMRINLQKTYSRPQLKGRSLNELAPAGKVWRTGANEAVEITLYKDMKLGETKVKAGTYTLYAIPEKESYTIIISKDLNVWGSYYYKETNDVARLKVPVTEAADSLEYFYGIHQS